MHLVLLASLELIFLEHEKHLLVKVLLQVILDQSLLHAGPPLTSMDLLTLDHLEELLLAPIEKQLFKVHLSVVRVIKFLEEAHAQFNVKIQIGCLRGALHEDDLH